MEIGKLIGSDLAGEKILEGDLVVTVLRGETCFGVAYGKTCRTLGNGVSRRMCYKVRQLNEYEQQVRDKIIAEILEKEAKSEKHKESMKVCKDLVVGDIIDCGSNKYKVYLGKIKFVRYDSNGKEINREEGYGWYNGDANVDKQIESSNYYGYLHQLSITKNLVKCVGKTGKRVEFKGDVLDIRSSGHFAITHRIVITLEDLQ